MNIAKGIYKQPLFLFVLKINTPGPEVEIKGEEISRAVYFFS